MDKTVKDIHIAKKLSLSSPGLVVKSLTSFCWPFIEK